MFDGTDTTVTNTEWYNLAGTKVVDSNSDGKYDTAASVIEPNATVNLGTITNKISYTLDTAIDNSYQAKSVKVTLTLCGYQYEELELENGYTDLAVQVTNTIINQQ